MNPTSPANKTRPGSGVNSFEAIGWDIENKRGYAETYKDVVHEGASKMGGRIYYTKQFTYKR